MCKDVSFGKYIFVSILPVLASFLSVLFSLPQKEEVKSEEGMQGKAS